MYPFDGFDGLLQSGRLSTAWRAKKLFMRRIVEALTLFPLLRSRPRAIPTEVPPRPNFERNSNPRFAAERTPAGGEKLSLPLA